MDKILVAADGSKDGERAVVFAAKLAKALDAELTVLTVSEGITSDRELKKFAKIEHAAIGDVLEAEAAAIATKAGTTAGRAGAKRVRIETAVGDAATVILDTAKGLKAGTIVVGRRGRGRLEGLLLGSVSQKLATLAACPVIVVP